MPNYKSNDVQIKLKDTSGSNSKAKITTKRKFNGLKKSGGTLGKAGPVKGSVGD